MYLDSTIEVHQIKKEELSLIYTGVRKQGDKNKERSAAGVRSIPGIIQHILGSNFQRGLNHRGRSGNWRETYYKYSLRRQHSADLRHLGWTTKYVTVGGRCQSRIGIGNQRNKKKMDDSA